MNRVKIKLITAAILSVTVSTALLLCLPNRPTGTLIVESDTEVLAKPFPRDYPFKNSKGANHVLKNLRAGEKIEFDDINYEKEVETRPQPALTSARVTSDLRLRSNLLG